MAAMNAKGRVRRAFAHREPDRVPPETEGLIRVLGACGGHILSSVHNIQPDVPVENILAMYDTGLAHCYGDIQR